MNWQEKVEVYPGADAGAPTIGTLAAAGAQLRTNTDVAWTNQPLRVFANNDVIQSVVSPFGGLFKVNSQASLDLWGTYANSDVIVALSRADVAGEPDSQLIQLAATSDGWAFAGEVFFDANAASTGAAGNYNSQINLLSYNDTIDTQVLNRTSTAEGAWIDVVGFAAQTNAFNFRISDAGGPITQFSPMVADGATAVAYLFDTSNAIASTSANARLMSVKTNGIERAGIHSWGGFISGTSAASTFAMDSSFLFAGWKDASEGETNEARFVFGCGLTDIIAASSAAVDTLGDSSAPEITMSVQAVNAGGDSSRVALFAGDGSAQVTIFVTNTMVTQLNPSVADSATAEAYLFSTENALANAGARIASFEIQATRKASIDVNGAYFVGANQVVGARVVDARIDDAINSGDATTDGVIDACRDALIAHGLCTAA